MLQGRSWSKAGRLSDSGAWSWKAIRVDKSKTRMSETFSELQGMTSREGGGLDSGEEQCSSPSHFPIGPGSSGMWQGPWLPITASSVSICWLPCHSRVRITPHSPGHACHQSLLKLLCTILQRVGGGGSPLGAERQMGRIIAFS